MSPFPCVMMILRQDSKIHPDSSTFDSHPLQQIKTNVSLLLWHHFLSILEVSICQGTFILAFCGCGILHRINTAVFGAWEMIFAKESCHIRPSNRPLTSCLSESDLARYLCEWIAVWLLPLKPASQTD